MADRFSAQVAFLGLDSRDERAAGEQFQREIPSGFPSVFDGDATVARSLGGGQGWPTTFFFDRDGGLVFIKIGAHADAEPLERDIRGTRSRADRVPTPSLRIGQARSGSETHQREDDMKAAIFPSPTPIDRRVSDDWPTH